MCLNDRKKDICGVEAEAQELKVENVIKGKIWYFSGYLRSGLACKKCTNTGEKR
jgi:hypothetical protein